MHYQYFVGHKPPEFPIWPGFRYFDYKNHIPHGNLQLNSTEGSNILSEYFSLFKLKLTIKELGAKGDDLITICQHRRFILNIMTGLPAKNLPARIIFPENIISVTFGPELLPRQGQSYLIGSPLGLKNGLMDQYARSHYIRDLLRFSADMIDARLLTNSEAEHLLNQKILIPAPSCGTFKVNFFLETMEYLEAAAEKFLQSGYMKYDDTYQSRVLGFLLERLNSWVLLRHLGRSALDLQELVGFTTIVSRDLRIEPSREI